MNTNFFPLNPSLGAVQQSDAGEATVKRAFPALLEWSTAQAVALSTTGVHAAIVDSGTTQIITTGITNPPCARNLTVTYGGTAGDIKGGHQVTAVGKDAAGADITEVLPAATADTAGTVQGLKAFASVSSLSCPAHDGTGATTAIGFGNKLGLEYKLARNTILQAHLDNAKEGTAPTVVVSSSVLSNNTMLLNSALNGTVVHAYALVP